VHEYCMRDIAGELIIRFIQRQPHGEAILTVLTVLAPFLMWFILRALFRDRERIDGEPAR
jgi:hypothetical protein